MKKITLFILACTLVATGRTMLGAAGAAAAEPELSPADQLWNAAGLGEPAEVKRILEEHGAQAYAEPTSHNMTFADFFSPEEEKVRADHLAVMRTHELYQYNTPADRQAALDAAAGLAKEYEEIRKVWDEYQASLPARPVAVPAVAPAMPQ